MSFPRRIRTIYWKELIDILRDRRTLIAMILVPIVLYPLLMLGSVQAVSYQFDVLAEETLLVGVLEGQERVLAALIEQDENDLARRLAQLDPDSEEARNLPQPLGRVEIVPCASPRAMRRAVSERRIQAGVLMPPRIVYSFDWRNPIRITADLEEVRSTYASGRLHELFQRTAERKVSQRLRRVGLPEQFVEPFEVSSEDLSSPPSILGQILPLILVLMTITGAIYPAIDLTAGERERGTLESLMVCPVPVIDLIVGKFLVVTTVAIMGATLNLASVSATVYFGGFDKIISTGGGSVPLGKMALILFCLIPFAVFMSAIMIAVCSYARTFKEAQNYVTPVILAVLIPGGIAALPGTRLDWVMLVMPVGNMVLLARELLLGADVPVWQVALVLLSTTFYAGAAVAVAASVFGKESVVFADAASFKSAFSRALIKPASRPSISMSLLVVALLFPAWFFVQSALSPEPDGDARGLLYGSGWLMPLLFVVVPAVIARYWKVSLAGAFALHVPSAWHLIGAGLIGVSAWVPAHELNVLQERVLGSPEAVMKSARVLVETVTAMPLGVVLVLLAVVPAVSEELLFRGFLLSGLRSSSRRWTAIVISAVIFGVFHFFIFKFAVPAGLGIVLAYVCWQSGSILPGMIAHLLHNGIGVLSAVHPEWLEWLGVAGSGSEAAEWTHLPVRLLVTGTVIFVLGILVAAKPAFPAPDHPTAPQPPFRNP